MLREIKTIHQLPMYSKGLFHSLAQIPLTLSHLYRFFGIAKKTLLSCPVPLLKKWQAVQPGLHSEPYGPNETLVVR